MNLGFNLLFGMMFKIISDVVMDFTPPWITNFNFPEQDANGDTVLSSVLSTGARVMYVSDSGDDTIANAGGAGFYAYNSFADIQNPATTPVAFKTLRAACANTRVSQADVVLLERGSVFTDTGAAIQTRGGININERAIISGYGVGANPIIDKVGEGDVFSIGVPVISDYMVIKDIDFTHNDRDPNHLNFVGWASLNFGGMCISISKTFRSVRSILIEGCNQKHYTQGIGVSGVTIPYFTSDIIIRRNVISNMYKETGGAHPQGISISGGHDEILVEENILDSNGFYNAVGTTSPATLYSHNIYTLSVVNSIYRNNISFNPSSIHLKFTAVVELDLSISLTGSVSQITVNSILPNTPPSGYISVKPEDAISTKDLITIPYTSYTGNVFTIPTTDFTARNVLSGSSKAAVNFPKSENVSIYGNLLFDGEVGISYGGNENTTNYSGAARFGNFQVQSNMFIEIGRSQNTGRTLGWGADANDNADGIFAHNIALGTSNINVRNKYAFDIVGYAGNLAIFNNKSTNGAGRISGRYDNGNSYYRNQIELTNAAYTNAPTAFADYLTANPSMGSTLEGFIDALKLSNKSLIKAKSSEVYGYFSARYTLVAPIISRNIYDLEVFSEEVATFILDVATNVPFTFQWYKKAPASGSFEAMVSETSNILYFTALIADQGAQYQCKALDGAGNLLESSIATLSVSVHSQFLRMGPDDNVPLTGTGRDLSSGKGVRFKYRSIINTASIPILKSSSGVEKLVILTTSKTISIKNNKNNYTIDIPNMDEVLTDGNRHTVTYIVENTGENQRINIDGVDYFGDITTASTDIIFYPQQIVNNATGSTYAGCYYEITDLEFLDVSGNAVLKFKLDSGEISGGVENSTVGTGTATMNVDSGSWIPA